MSRLTFPDTIPMHYRESFFKDPFFSDCWNVMNKNSLITEKHTEKTSAHFTSTKEEHGASETEENKVGEEEEAESTESSKQEKKFTTTTSSSTSKESCSEETRSGSSSGENMHSSTSKAWLGENSEGRSKIVSDSEKFQVMIEVDHFLPEELSVKIVNNYVVVEGRHEEKSLPKGYITRQFTRKYLLPMDCNPDKVSCHLSPDEILVVTVLREKDNNPPLKETIIDIQKSDKNLKDVPPTAAG